MRSGRYVKVNMGHMKLLVENNPHYTTRLGLGELIQVSKSIVENYLHQLGFVNNFHEF